MMHARKSLVWHTSLFIHLGEYISFTVIALKPYVIGETQYPQIHQLGI